VPTLKTKRDYNEILGIKVDSGDELTIEEIQNAENIEKEQKMLDTLKNLQRLKRKQKKIIEKCRKDPFIPTIFIPKEPERFVIQK
jgi:predicted Zn-ribbon and HTH transcriptional regulator